MVPKTRAHQNMTPQGLQRHLALTKHQIAALAPPPTMCSEVIAIECGSCAWQPGRHMSSLRSFSGTGTLTMAYSQMNPMLQKLPAQGPSQHDY